MTTKKQPAAKKPRSVPAEAVFNAASNQWELGSRDAKGRQIGEWRYWWPTTGHFCCMNHFEDGGRKETYTRFHPDGTYSRKGIDLNGRPAPNEVIYYQKSKNPTTELALTEPEYKKVFRVEETFIRKGLSKWKNFDAKGRRIELDGTLMPMLAPQSYAKNFRPFSLPDVLARLVEFQNDVVETFAEGFSLAVDDKGLVKNFCASQSKQREFAAAFLPIGDANGSGSGYCVWNNGASKNAGELPIVVFGDEGGCHVVAENLRELLSLVAADVEPMIDNDEVSFYKGPDHEPSPEIAAFRKWLKSNVGITPTKKPTALVRKAQKRHKAAFDAWLKKFS